MGSRSSRFEARRKPPLRSLKVVALAAYRAWKTRTQDFMSPLERAGCELECCGGDPDRASRRLRWFVDALPAGGMEATREFYAEAEAILARVREEA